MEIKNLLSKYESIKLVPRSTLFEPDLYLAKTKKVCPICLNKLYPMRNKPFWHCRSRKNKHSFVISNEKMK